MPIVWTVRLKKLILPPSGPLLVGLVGAVLLATRSAKLGTAFIALSLVTLYLLSAPWFVNRLLRTLDRYPSLDLESPPVPEVGAIVILDAGRRPAPPDRGGDAVSSLTLERLHEGARVYRGLGAPVLVSGDGARELMAEVLDRSFGVQVRWIEPDSRNTHENAVRSAGLLCSAGIGRVALVTHFWHMPRAAAAFGRAGLEVVPAPHGFSGPLRSQRGLMAFAPSATALTSGSLALHEWIGIVWYRIRYRHG